MVLLTAALVALTAVALERLRLRSAPALRDRAAPARATPDRAAPAPVKIAAVPPLERIRAGVAPARIVEVLVR